MTVGCWFLSLLILTVIFGRGNCEEYEWGKTWNETVIRAMCRLKDLDDSDLTQCSQRTSIKEFNKKSRANGRLICQDVRYVVLAHGFGVFMIDMRKNRTNSELSKWAGGVISEGTRMTRNVSGLESYQFRLRRIFINGTYAPDETEWIHPFPDGYHPKNVTNIIIGKPKYDPKWSPSGSWKVEISFTPSYDRPCFYEVRCQQDDGEYNETTYLKDEENSFSVTFEHLPFGANFTVTIKSLTVRLKADHITDVKGTSETFKTPRCSDLSEGQVCIPEAVKGLNATATHKMGNVFDVHVTWDDPDDDGLDNTYDIAIHSIGGEREDQFFDLINVPLQSKESIVFSNVTILDQYHVNIRCINSIGTGPTISKHFTARPKQTEPEQVSGIRAVDIHDTNMTLKWDIPRGEYNAFEVQYTSLNEMMREVLIKRVTNSTVITITGLRPYRNYSYTFTVISGTKSTSLNRSRSVSAIFTTSESRPEQVVSFNALKIRPTDITFEWSLPIEKQNGIIRRFNITYGLKGSTQPQVASFEPNEFRGVIGSLMPGQTYHFNIQAETIIGLGPGKTLQQQMPEISAPPKPKPEDVPVTLRGSSTVIQVRIKKDFFSEDNGAIISHSIIITENSSIDATGPNIRSWSEVQNFTKWPPYKVIVPLDRLTNGSTDFKIGEENCEETTSLYCNGPLKSGATFRIKMRAYTDADKFTDTRYSSPIQTRKTAGEGLNAVTTHKAGDTFDLHVTWDSPDLFPDFYIVNVILNNSKISDPVFHNVSGEATETVFSDVKISKDFNVYVRAWTSNFEGLEISRRFILPLTNSNQIDILMPLCLAGVILVVVMSLGIAVCGFFWLQERKQAQGQQVDEWEIVPDQLLIWQILGTGAFGVVKLGSLRDDQGNRTNVAVKMLRDGWNKIDMQNLLHEITTMKELNKHPNIVSLIGYRTTGPYPFLVVEYCSRGDLQSFLRKSLTELVVSVDETKKHCTINEKFLEYGEIFPKNSNRSSTSRTNEDCTQAPSFPENQDTSCEPVVVTLLDMLNFGRQIAIGMEYLSSNKIVHRDLAARNVLVCEDRSVKISDFGLRRDIFEKNFYLKQRNGRIPMKWMAIEAFVHQVYTTSSDVWSFGVLLWEIMTLGGCPYPGIPPMEILERLQLGYRMERPENCSIPLYNVMLSCWQDNPRKRPTFTILRQKLDKLFCMAAKNVYFDPTDDLAEISFEDDDLQILSSRRISCSQQVKFVNDLEPRIINEELDRTKDEASNKADGCKEALL